MRLEPLLGGRASTVYRIIRSNGRSVVFKSAEARVVETEAIWLRGWREIGIDTPEVYANGVLDDLTPYLLMALVDGPSVYAELAAGRLPYEETMKQTGRMLATMHTIRSIGFGSALQDHLDSAGRGQFQTLREQFAAETLPLGLSFALEVGAISAGDLDAVERAVDVLSEHVVAVGARRTHGDFRVGNMLRDGDRLVVIDPAPALTHPYICLAYSLILPELATGTMPAALLAGYDEVSPVDARALEAALLIRAGIMFNSFGRRQESVYGQRLPRVFARLRERIS
jgi:fructosamine-3-kinase